MASQLAESSLTATDAFYVRSRAVRAGKIDPDAWRPRAVGWWSASFDLAEHAARGSAKARGRHAAEKGN